MATREQNERRFPHWLDLANGGRRYWYDVPGKTGGFARYVKIVDGNEVTLRIVQEIYDSTDQLIEVHEMYPVDTGHRFVNQTDKE